MCLAAAYYETLKNGYESGKDGKKYAEDHAREEYVQFALRRRAYKESLGEEESIKALEDAAKLVGQGNNKLEP